MSKRLRLPSICPACENPLKISELFCETCGTKVSGKFPLPPLLRLSEDEQKFVLDFVKLSGSLKDMSAKLSLSYPTVRNMLDEIINKLDEEGNQKE